MEKKFDCVKMKDAIQRRLASGMVGRSAEECADDIRAVLSRSASPVGGLWRRLVAGEHRVSADGVAEEAVVYSDRGA